MATAKTSYNLNQTKMPNQILLVTGVAVLVTGVSAYRNPNAFRKLLGNFSTTPAVLYTLGLVTLVIGLFLVINFSAWTTIPEAIVAFIGITAVIKGFMMIIFPRYSMAMSQKLWRDKGHMHGESILLMAMGIILIGASFL
jgi:uncharacterized protein YjeT (DUF2065 family)